MTDLHSHILPAIDDGAQNLDQATAIARIAVADGIRTMVATPHCDLRDIPHFLARRDQASTTLQAELDRRNIPLRILPGAECRIVPQLLRAAHENPGIRLAGGQAILVELDPAQPLEPLAELLFQATCENFAILLAHPERHPGIRRHPDALDAMVQRGLLLQITAAALAPLQAGWQNWWTARKILRRHHQACILATDTHDPEISPPILAKPARVAARITRQSPETFVRNRPDSILKTKP